MASGTELDDRTIADAVEILTYGARQTGRSRPVRTYADGRADWSSTAREIYSYGRHFPLARFVPAAGRRRPLWIINGDDGRGGGSGWRISRTPDHQDSVRRAIAATGLEAIILPFSALAGAGIVIDSVRPVHVRRDHEWTETIVVRTLEEIPQWRRENGPAHRGYTKTAQGFYSWEEARHRLGDAVFTAVRESRVSRRPRAGEISNAVAATWKDRETCDANPFHARGTGEHVADATGRACVYCQRELAPIAETRATRARYLSSFDYQENPPLYFLAQVPRGAGADTVDAALEALAPRAVHAARARGKEVLRQGDIFLIPTGLTRAELEARGATFARLTQWTRDARPRKGEAGYRAPLDAAGRRREARYRKRLWRETFRDAVAKATAGETETARPQTPKGSRRKWAKARADHARELETARATLRRAILGADTGRYGRRTRYQPSGYSRGWGPSALQQERDGIARNARGARERIDELEARGARVGDAWNREGYRSRAHQRDFYRRMYGANALAAFRRAELEAARRYRPQDLGDTDEHRRRRESARRTLAIYGTAHAATETARVPGGYFYACGTVRHVPDLEPGRDGARDHAPLELAQDVWYLAVRNTVPRQ